MLVELTSKDLALIENALISYSVIKPEKIDEIEELTEFIQKNNREKN